MPRYYCDYCDAYLTHDSMAGRQQHMRGWKHRENFRNYYQQFYPGWVAEQQQQAMLHQQRLMGIPNAPYQAGPLPPMPFNQPPIIPNAPGAPMFRPPPGAPPMSGFPTMPAALNNFPQTIQPPFQT